ncbi:MBL fold metallo-hydrolase [Streptomyces diacarni]|uniref:MBL fold metallo-hydrolase n=1 Tax=Streptomyces diacarni TaxID=2800381 RepID=A0A367EAR7_9ACTN|nr:MBL fold metallo-hydrolase [Streptomyces diacarni]RCG14437.1 MBL fold metallo-hydrolase [Streptomyces diacarni]
MDDDSAEILFIGNATLLIRYGELTLLTDPNFLHQGQHAHLGYGLLSRRLTEPAVDLEDLPPDLDAVVLSHLHGDHWDRTARRGLDRGLPILTTPHASRVLQGAQGFRRAMGLRTWESHTLVRGQSRVRVTAVPGRHAFGPLEKLLPPVMGSVLECGPATGPARLRIYLSGDTLLFEGLREIKARCPDLNLAVLHLGGTTLPGGKVVTMDGGQGAELVRLLRPRLTLPVHYDDYTVFKSPLDDFVSALEARGLEDRLVDCPRGARVTVGAAAEVSKVGPVRAPAL